jgi:MinD-like ATPase involved in chromosome partitioning or flagellar assembly
MRRIITVSSGKGGVGKTTFATNFALTLSRVAPTVLIDLDTGTSSVRNTLDTTVTRDLYHFFRRGEKLERCLSTLDHTLDPDGLFRDFAFIGAPRHAIDEITNLSDTSRWKLVHAINELPAAFIVLDLRAGLDANVIDFLPLSNSGVLVFTPHHPAATLAAGDIVKSLLFRKLRFIFAEDSPFYERIGDRKLHRLINELLDQVEDVYEERLPNLDAFLADLGVSLGGNPYLNVIAEVVHSFGVYFVLNMFSGVEESYEQAILPFGEYLRDYVSSRLRLTNLGWVVQDDMIHKANCERRPILLHPVSRPKEQPVNRVMDELAKLESSALGLPQPRDTRLPTDWMDEIIRIEDGSPIARQLDVLSRMYRTTGLVHVRDNFAYIAHRALHVVRQLPAEAFGHPRLFTPFEMYQQLFPDQRRLLG